MYLWANASSRSVLHFFQGSLDVGEIPFRRRKLSEEFSFTYFVHVITSF